MFSITFLIILVVMSTVGILTYLACDSNVVERCAKLKT